MIAIYPGSFDPPTVGHVDIIRRAAKLCDTLHVLVLVNPQKRPWFAPEQRVGMLRDCIVGLPNVEVGFSDQPLLREAERLNADALIRGIRDSADYQEARPVAEAFLRVGNIETLFIPSDPALGYVSSSLVREMMSIDVPVDELVPPEIRDRLTERSD